MNDRLDLPRPLNDGTGRVLLEEHSDGSTIYLAPVAPTLTTEQEALVHRVADIIRESGRTLDAAYKASLGYVAITPEEQYLADHYTGDGFSSI